MRTIIKQATRYALRSLGYEIRRIHDSSQNHSASSIAAGERVVVVEAPPPRIEPIWPLPNRSRISAEEILQRFSRDELWHYAYEFEGA